MKISNTIAIKCTPEKVFYWIENPDRAVKWMTSVTKTEIIEETSNRVGTTFREYVEEKGRGTEMHGVVTDFVLNKRIAFHLEGDYNSADVEFVLEEKDGITQITQNARVDFKGILRILSIFLGIFFKKNIISQAQREIANLKELCERDV